MKLLDSKKYKSLAESNFLNGYNDAQSIILAFKDVLKSDYKALCKSSTPFGGGIARLRETCGALSGAIIVLGYLYGYCTPETGEIKQNLYELTQNFVFRFEKEFGSIHCRTLLNLKEDYDSPIPSIRDEKYYKNRPCKNIISKTAFMLAEYINELEKEI